MGYSNLKYYANRTRMCGLADCRNLKKISAKI